MFYLTKFMYWFFLFPFFFFFFLLIYLFIYLFTFIFIIGPSGLGDVFVCRFFVLSGGHSLALAGRCTFILSSYIACRNITKIRGGCSTWLNDSLLKPSGPEVCRYNLIICVYILGFFSTRFVIFIYHRILTLIPQSDSQDTRCLLNYCGISLLSELANIYANILNQRLIKMLEVNKVFSRRTKLFQEKKNSVSSTFTCLIPLLIIESCRDSRYIYVL